MKLEYRRILRMLNEQSPDEYLKALNSGWEVYEKRLCNGYEEIIFGRPINEDLGSPLQEKDKV